VNGRLVAVKQPVRLREGALYHSDLSPGTFIRVPAIGDDPTIAVDGRVQWQQSRVENFAHDFFKITRSDVHPSAMQETTTWELLKILTAQEYVEVERVGPFDLQGFLFNRVWPS